MLSDMKLDEKIWILKANQVVKKQCFLFIETYENKTDFAV